MVDMELKAHGKAFGDGSHPTTIGVLTALEAIEPEVFAPRAACDMGAGSGILSLAIATKFGCPVVAVDIERQSVETLRENAAHNHVGDYIIAVHSDGFRHPDILRHAPYDLMVMNILAEPLLALAVDATTHLAEGGVLILSGLLLWQKEQILQAYTGLGLELASKLQLDGWLTLCFQKP
jgi:ribosomal protein L11 methyltransferase